MRVIKSVINLVIFLAVLAAIAPGCTARQPCTQVAQIGWSVNQVLDSCGEPNDINRTRTARGSFEQWIYYYYDAFLGYQPQIARYYIYIENGRVVSMQD